MQTNNYDAIPGELKALNQWIVWRLEDIGAKKPTKVPYSPKHKNQLAAVDDPTSWGTFDEALSTYQQSITTNHSSSPQFSGIGLVFTANDPYSFIDLDNTDGDQVAQQRQIKIFQEFDSYSEVSPSGMGLHVIVKGDVPSGRRRSFIEVYSTLRYATFTGNIYNNKNIINERQNLLTQLWEQMASGGAATNVYKGDEKETQTDEEIIAQARNAANGDKFSTLFAGNWQSLYQSQSEADYAIIDIIAFYSQNRNQVSRIFRASALGARDKAKRQDYVNGMILRSFDRMLPQIDFDGFKIALDQKIAEQQLALPISGIVQPGRTSPFDGEDLGSNPNAIAINKESEAMQVGPTNNTIDNSPHPNTRDGGGSINIPPGLLGEIAQFIYQAAPRPVPEIALAGALGLMAGICGRAYNVSGTGLNQYVLLLAATGTGKEAMASGIDRLMNAISLMVPTSSSFIGPSEIASGQALVKYLYKTSRCFVSILGEFGLRLESMSSIHANPAEKMLKRMLLDLFNKSGHGTIFKASIFADADKNINVTEAPAFSILGESTPERFYGALNEEMISEGLLPRFVLIEYNGPRPILNEKHVNFKPPFFLVQKFAALVANVEMITHAKRVIDVHSTDEAYRMFKSFDKYADKQINGTNKEVLRQLWNRAHMKAMKIAGLVAVGVNMSEPTIEASHAQWAIDIVQNDIGALSSKFEAGEIGSTSSESKQLNEVRRMIKEYVSKDWNNIKNYCQGKNMKILFDNKIVTYVYLNKRLSATSAFRLDRAGSTIALKRALQNLIDSDNIREVGKQDLAIKYGTSQKSYIVSDANLII